MKTYFPIICILWTALIACQKEEVLLFEIDSRASGFVNTFYEEAEKRGIQLPKDNLILEFTSDPTLEYCGQCIKPKNNRSGQRTVQINLSGDCWQNEPDQNKEALIFHELGHCLLNRGHKDDVFPSGAPRSLMITQIDGPYQPCEYVLSDDPEAVKKCNLTVRRPYYLDELFNENLAAIPDWANQ